MKKRTIGAGLAVLAILGFSLAPADASDGNSNPDDVQVVNTETLQVYVSPDGGVESKRVYEQLSLTGHGPVTIENPVGKSGLRNIDGFGGLSVRDGVQTIKTDVDGYQRLRSVEEYTGDLPLSVSIGYFLDGKKIDPSDVLGANGELEVVYTVKNTTVRPQEVSFPDGKGGTMTATVQVPVPLVGTMTASLPPSFTDVTSPQANLAGDGQGGTVAAFTMTLFPPLGSDEMKFSYKARVSDAVVPPTAVTVLPVNPLESPTFKTAGDSYKSGAASGVQLAEGATLIDDNLLRLRDGAGDLLAGLIQLHDGSGELAKGLSDEAAPGARKLSDGLGQLDDGVGTLSSGADQLADGQRSLADGLTKLYNGVQGLPASVKGALKQNKDYLKLLGSLTSIADGVGSLDDPATKKSLLGGLNAIQEGLDYPGQDDCIKAASGAEPEKCGVVDALTLLSKLLPSIAVNQVESIKTQLDSLWATNACAGTLTTGLTGLTGECADIAKAYDTLYAPSTGSLISGGVEAKFGAVAASLDKVVASLQEKLLAPGAGLDQLRAGLSNPKAGDCAVAVDTTTTSDDCGVKEGSIYLRDVGIPMLVDGIAANVRTQLIAGIGVPTKGCNPEKTLRCGAEALADGGQALTAGVDQLVSGVTQLNDGGSQLADGLDAAAAGSQQLEDGLGQARQGAPKLVDGADRLSKEGMSKLIDAGQDTAQTYGKMYATIEAGATRANQEKMLFGAPEGAQGLTAYSYELRGDDGQGSRNLKRGVATMVLFGLSAGALLLRRRLV